jgi:hypothetical protein
MGQATQAASRRNTSPPRGSPAGASVSRTVAALRAAGAEVLTMRLPDPEPSSPPPTRLAEVGWMATKGTA